MEDQHYFESDRMYNANIFLNDKLRVIRGKKYEGGICNSEILDLASLPVLGSKKNPIVNGTRMNRSITDDVQYPTGMFRLRGSYHLKICTYTLLKYSRSFLKG